MFNTCTLQFTWHLIQSYVDGLVYLFFHQATDIFGDNNFDILKGFIILEFIIQYSMLSFKTALEFMTNVNR